MSIAAVLAAAMLLPAAHPDRVPTLRTSARAPNVARFGISPFVPAPDETMATEPAERTSAEQVERALATAAPGTLDLVLERNLARWTAEQPQAAARFAELQPDSFLREVALRTVARVWAGADPAAAARWAAALGDTAAQDQAIETAALAMADVDPRAALDLLERRDDPTPADAARSGVIVSWAGRDFEAAEAWVEAQPTGPARDEIVQRLVLLRAGRDPSAGTLLANRLITGDTARHDAWAAIAQLRASKDPQDLRDAAPN